MAIVGYLVMAVLLIAALALAIAECIFFTRKPDWFVKATGFVVAVLGFAIMLAFIISFATEGNPFNLIFFMIMSSVGIIAFLFWLAMLVASALNETDNNERLLWVLIIIFTNFVGALIYFLARRPIRLKSTPR